MPARFQVASARVLALVIPLSGFAACSPSGPEPVDRLGALFQDEMAVVDPYLRVRGIEGLRVADASIMPAITNGNINAPCMMIGERAADLILNP